MTVGNTMTVSNTLSKSIKLSKALQKSIKSNHDLLDILCPYYAGCRISTKVDLCTRIKTPAGRYYLCLILLSSPITRMVSNALEKSIKLSKALQKSIKSNLYLLDNMSSYYVLFAEFPSRHKNQHTSWELLF